MKRCFIAIEMPQNIKDELINLQAKLKSLPVRVKWVEKENFHLTLKFLGDIDEKEILSVLKCLEMIADKTNSIELKLDKVGAFPNLQSPKVIWMGINDKEKRLNGLKNTIENELSFNGFSRDNKSFSPHLTLGRVKENINDSTLKDIIKTTNMGLNGFQKQVKINEIVFMESKLTANGPIYSCIQKFRLQEHL